MQRWDGAFQFASGLVKDQARYHETQFLNIEIEQMILEFRASSRNYPTTRTA
jgi:hypothetical protein